jgi:AraC-like DNA-binding protein
LLTKPFGDFFLLIYCHVCTTLTIDEEEEMALNKPNLIDQGFVITESLPSDFVGFQLAGGGVLHAQGPAGSVIIQQLNYPLFSIRYKVMQITKPFQLLCDKGQDMLIALLALKNSVKCNMEGIGTWFLRPGEFLLLRSGHHVVTSQMEVAEDNQVFEIGYATDILDCFAPYFPLLQMQPTGARTPYLLTKHGLPAGPRAMDIAHEVLRAPVEATVQSLYFQFKVREYLLLLLSATSQPHNGRPDLSSEQSARLAQIADRLRTETAKKFPIHQLAREMQMNEMKLKTVFKAVYGKGIHSYQLDARMHEAHKLLELGELTTKAIAGKVGYELTTSFITKFREYFGYPPSQVSKR